MFARATAHFSFPPLFRAFALLSFLGSPAASQVAIDSWTADSGLPQNIGRAICQTPDGYLWLATFDGLVRFDGVRFTTFNRSNTPGINGNRFGSLFCTADGEIWAGTEGSGVTRYHKGRFVTYSVRDGLASNNVLGISDGGGKLWVLTRGSVNEWRPADQRFVPLNRAEYGYSDALTPDGQMGFWKIDKTAFYLFAHGERSRYLLPSGWPRGVPVVAGLDLDRHIWLATASGQLAHLIDGHWLNASYDRAEQSTWDAKAGLRSTYHDSKGHIWHSKIVWSSSTGWMQYLELPPGTQPVQIAFNTLFEDREGNIWLSTDGEGLFRLHTQAIQVYSKEQGLPDRNVYPVYQCRDKTLWFGTWNGGLCRFREGKFRTYTTMDGLASNRVNTIFEDRNGGLWVGADYGLRHMRNNRFEPVRDDAIPSGSVIRAIHQDPQGAMWFGTNEGLIRFDNDRWTFLAKKDGLATEDVRVIIDGQDGALWIGGYGGLSCLRGGQVHAWTEQDGLPSNTIRALYEDTDGVLWIGTYDGGLGRLERGKFTKYTVQQGLFNDGAFQILEDSRANLWMSCNRGIYRVSKRQLNDIAAGKTNTVTSIAYGRSDGMRNIECNGGLTPAGIRAQDGKLWFPTQDGVAVFDPERLAANPKPPPVLIESCLIDRAPAVIDNPVPVTTKNESIEIQYAALSLSNPERIRFRYKMQGLDHRWVEAGTRRTAYYSHLPPGRYTFEVTAAHSDGVWNQAGANLALIVLPPFYQTWWFALGLSALACASLWLVWRYRLSQVERARAAQQAFSRQLMASQENERKRIASELHDSLGQRLVIIKNLALLLLQRNCASGLNAQQCGQIEEISEEVSGAAREVKEISYNLRPYRLDRLGLTAALEAMIETASAASATCFSAQIDNIDGALPKEMEINFYRIVQECVNNILKHAQAAHATVRLECAQERLTMTMRDDGKGFAPDSARPDSSPEGFGLIGISERAQLLGGVASIHSTPGKGTTVTVEIPSKPTV